ncbi:fumarylacetoacetase [Catellatospora bangladeshensis]|uniref:fumarylacetoacetase n=1 Tax=Catellatospora bangladeshensis TaxID=310355 RepID=A0A8J3NMU0_9ACTN|nr:fumarylacetoacetase [Catellatospora bangladeshensis]GIF86532.1 fumarylacetoacetase [Catellatospora bangladeshensis]
MTWVPGAAGSGYDIDHLPYGVIVPSDGRPRCAVRIADVAFDLDGAEAAGLVLAADSLRAPNLDVFLGLGPAHWSAVRERITELLTDPAHRAAVEPLLIPLASVTNVLAWSVADYVDFYSSEHHASNVGQIFRPGQPPLLPNWKHVPIGYHGRAGTVVVSGTPVVRPSGQLGGGVFGPCRRLDIEAEVGFVVGAGSTMGEPVPWQRFGDHVFGVVLVNDWSARDIQAWEYQPLGPFLAKSFATSVSAWITPLAALGPDAWTDAPVQEPAVQPYLADDRRALDLAITVEWNDTVVAAPPFRTMYWTPAQQLAHLTVNGASLRTGDLFASGTVSGPERGQVGSFLELTWGGREPVMVKGEERTFLVDGDTVVLRARVGDIELGAVAGTVFPARS